MTTITLFAGDGIGPEISAAVSRIIQSVCPDITFEPCEIGQTAYEHTGELIPQSAIDSLEKNRIALKGPCTTPVGKGFRSVNVQLRTRFDLYQNIRPAKSLPSVSTRFSDVNLVVFRENTEDLYIGEEIMISPDEAHGSGRKGQRIRQQRFHIGNQPGAENGGNRLYNSAPLPLHGW